jgi:hypothetical protein
MADQKISTMTELASINSGDYIEVSEDDGGGGYNTKKYDLGDLATAESQAHAQNTDTGTTSTTFQVDSGNSGPKLKQDSGTLYVRNEADDADAAVKAASYKTGTYTLTIDETKSLSEKADASDYREISYSTISVDAAAMVPCTTNGAAAGTNEYGTNDIDLDYLAFDGGATEERVQFKTVMPEDWDLGTIKAKFYWSSATGSTTGDTVEWGIKAGALTDSDAIDATLGTAVTVSDALLADNGTDLQISDATGAMTVGGTPALGKMVVFEIYRNIDGTDDMTEDAWLFGVVIQYGQTATAMSAW